MYWNWLHRETWLHFMAFTMMNDELLLPFSRYEQNNQTNCFKNSSASFFLNLLKRKICSLVAPGNYFLHFFNNNKLPLIKCSNSKVDFTNTCVFIYLSIYLSISWKLYKSIVKRAAELDTVQFWTENCIIWIDSPKTLRCKEVSRPTKVDWKDWISFISSVFVPKFEKKLFGELQIAKTS